MSRRNNFFKQVPITAPKRNMFDLGHELKMSGKFGVLYPILCQEALPGDTFREDATIMCRFAPMLAPVMHRIDVTTHFFFVPNRLLTDVWEDFITGGQDGTDAPTLPYVQVNSLHGMSQDVLWHAGSLWDYLGLPTREGNLAVAGSGVSISVLPFRAYQKIFNDYYRDPNLMDEVVLDTELTGNVSSTFVSHFHGALRVRGWEKDYFTSCLPWAQRGAEVLMPIEAGGTALLSELPYIDFDGASATGDTKIGAVGLEKRFQDSAGGSLKFATDADVEIDESSVSINDFRRALALQRWLENNARGGARYTEQIMSHYGVQVPDYRLQRSEYLGGGRQPVVVSEVLSTAASKFDEVDSPVGDMAGHGLSVGRSNRFNYRCQEHGFVIGILSVMPRSSYSQGLPRWATRFNKFDYAFPELAHLGEQEVKQQEVMYAFESSNDDYNATTFGYIPRYSEYKFQNDRIAGDFKTTLQFWHLSRIFKTLPALDSDFVTMYENGVTPASEVAEETYRRIFAVEDGTDYLWFQIAHRLTVMRPLPYFGVPSIK